MTLDELRKKVIIWDSHNTSNESIASAKYMSILTQIEYHAKNEWRVYLPAEHPDFSSNYMERLAAWIGNATTDDNQKLLLEYALHISFFSHDDFVALYRTAFNREIYPWVALQSNAKLNQHGQQCFHEFVRYQVHYHTWFCPVTDSMDINEFYKVNHLAGISYRPGFAALQMMENRLAGNSKQIANIWTHYMACPNNNHQAPSPPIKYLVLLEDVVGSGSQCLDAVRWAVENLGKPVLFIPLILCPNGVEALQIEAKKWNGLLTVRPIIELNRSDLLGAERRGEKAWPISEDIEKFAVDVAGAASPSMDPFGYKSTGCSVTTFSNTPDNTLPIVHNKPKNNTWEPLFPRVYRD